MVKVHNGCVGAECYVTGWLYINAMILLVDNSDSPSIVKQLQQGLSLDCYTLISDCS